MSVVVLFASASIVFGQAQPSTNQSTAFGPNGCGRVDPVYIQTANETGGMPMFLQPSEVGKAFQLVRESTRNNVATVFWATGTLGGKPQTIEIPVDSEAKRITFTFSVDTKGGTIRLTQPSGGVITQGLADTEVTELNCGRIVTVISPEAGAWRAEISGTGRFWMEAQAQSDIYFISVEFVEKGGRPGHEGLFRIQGQPVVGTAATLKASLSARVIASTEFYLVSERGQAIQKLQMQAVSSDQEFKEFAGSLSLPDVPFRVAAMGKDLNGRQYQRFFPTLFHAESVEVSAKADVEELPAGSSRRIEFTVRNIGLPRTFKINVTDTHQFVSKVEPKEIALAAGESGAVWVDLTLPAGAVPGGGEDVVFVAASSAGPPTTNSSVVHFSVFSPDSTQNPR